VGSVDRDTALAFLGGIVDLVEAPRTTAVQQRGHLCERCGERGLAVIDVTDGADIDVWFLEHDYSATAFLLGYEANPRAGIWALLARDKTQKPPRAEAGGGEESRDFSGYLRDDSGSRAHESDDDAEGNDWDWARETELTKRTMASIIATSVARARTSLLSESLLARRFAFAFALRARWLARWLARWFALAGLGFQRANDRR